MTFPVSLTPSALKMCAKKLISRGGGTVRVGVKGGGCSGFSYVLAFEDNEARSTDILQSTFDEETNTTVEFRCDPKSALLLRGASLDYVDNGLNGKGFSFSNPSETSRCGCGVSFSV